MDREVALVSTYGAIKDEYREDGLKLAFLWHDEVMIEILSLDEEDKEIDRLVGLGHLQKGDAMAITDVIVPVTRRVSKDLRKRLTALDFRGYPRWGGGENFTYPDPSTPEEYAHNELLRKIGREWGGIPDDGVEYAEGRARVAVDAVTMWRDVNQEISCSLQASDDERAAMKAVCLFNAPPKSKFMPYKLFEASVPSLKQVPWSEIVRIKKRGNFDNFRSSMRKMVSDCGGDLEYALKRLKSEEEIAFCEIIERYRPAVKPVLAEALWSNVPNIPFVNPVGVYFGWKNVIAEREKAKRFDWCYILRDVRAAVEGEVNSGDA